MSRFTIRKALAAVVILSAIAPSAARAQAGAPVVVLTAKSAGELIGDLRYLLSAVAPPGDPAAAQALQTLDALKDPAALKGLDPARPLGAYAAMGEGADASPSVVLFLPVLDGKALLAALEGLGAMVDANSGVPGFSHKVTLPGGNVPPLFVADAGKYLFLTPIPANADALKAIKPEALLPRRAGAGDLSLTLRLDRIPQAFKDMFKASLEENIKPQRERQPGEDDAAYKARQTGIDLTQNAFLALVRDGKELALDVVIDPKAEFVGLELNSSAGAGTPYAASLKTFAAMKSKFRGLAKDSAVGGIVTVPLAQGIRDIMTQALDKAKSEAIEKAKDDPAQKKLLSDLDAALRPTLTGETLDMALAIQGPFPSTSGGDPTYAMTSALAVKDGKKLEAAVMEGLATVPADKKKDLTLNAAKAADGTAIHRMTHLNDDGKDPAPFGEATAYFAFRDDVIALALGKNGQDALSQALAASGAPAGAGAAPQVDLFVAASRISGMASTPDERKAMKAASSEVFAGPAATQDKVRLTLKAEGDTLTLRLGTDILALKFASRVGAVRGKVGE